ncbi:MAG: protein kinase [Polyangiaceae bacterium]|nr:protein kinase [Polyangiaceae bacterium]
MHVAPQVGSILLGKYRVERVLGKGGMGFVVAARHEHLGELFAIKMMLPEALMYPDARERFMREARSAARLKGEHVARVHDVGTLEDGSPYMVMEHLTGDDLSAILDKRGALPVSEAAFYAYQACEAVAEAHALGIVHRDLKPSNMFLTCRPNGTPCVKVLDFGISKDLDPNKVGPALTKTGTIIGTPVYMAPEQMANNKMTDARSDIWSLGIILHELVTGEVPFIAESMTELVTKVLTNAPVPPSHVRPGIPREFDAIVLRCLEKQPHRRFASVPDLMAALHPFISSNWSHAPSGLPPPPAYSRPDHVDMATVKEQRPVAPGPQAMGVPIGPHGLPRLNVTNATTAAQPLPFGANLPYVPTVATPLQSEPIAPARSQGFSAPAPAPRQTDGAWGGPNGTSSGNRGKTWLVAGLAVGAIIAVGLTGWVVALSTASDDPVVVRSTVPPENLAPVVSAMPMATVERVVEEPVAEPQESVAKPQESVGVAPSAPIPTTHKAVETKPPVTKPPTSKVPDF